MAPRLGVHRHSRRLAEEVELLVADRVPDADTGQQRRPRNLRQAQDVAVEAPAVSSDAASRERAG